MRDHDEPATDYPATQPDAPGTYLLWFISVLFALLIFYALSVGPAIKLRGWFPSAQPAMRAFYSPLRIVANHSEQVRRFLNWYVRLWGAKD
jgi:hypothetical protein